MTTVRDHEDELAQSIARVLAGVGLVLFCLAVGLTWPLTTVAGGFQLFGLALASLGIPVVPPWLVRLEHAAATMKATVDRWIVRQRERLQEWWRRLRGRPIVRSVNLAGEISGAGGISAKATIGRPPIDRDTISERAWLALLDDQMTSVYRRLELIEEGRSQDRADIVRRLDAQGNELRAHTLAVTRQGWQYIVSGLACSALGTALGMAA